MSLLQPTIGRQVWFRGIPWAAWNPDLPTGAAQKTPVRLDANQPMAATIVYVHHDRCVNLDVTDHAGVHWPQHGVTLRQEGEAMHHGTSYAEWMPYQLGQAKPSPAMNHIVVGMPQPMARPVGRPFEGLPSHWPELQPNITMAGTLAVTGPLSKDLQ